MSSGLKKVAQVAVGAAIGFAQGGPIGAVIGAGLAFYSAQQQEKLNTKSPVRENEPSAQTVRSSKAPARFILGRVSTGGILVWAQEEPGAQANGEWLHLVYVLCEGAIDALEEIYLGEELISTYGTDASYELVVNPTQVNAFLKANCPDWKDSQIGRGLSFVRLSLRYNAEKFPSGIPDARFVVRGRNDLYDPRTGTAGYSENTALHLLWFLRERCKVPDDEIVFETFASGANVCDESVGNPDGTVSPRYRSSAVIGADEQRTNVLQKLEAACAGKVIRVGGRWMFQAGAYYGPYDFEITEDMVIGTVTGSTEPTNDAAINTVRGTFIDPSQSWTETDYPEVSVAAWVIEDGGEAAETVTFSYVPYPYQVQRLANIELRRRRAGGVISAPLNLLGYNCRPGRVVRVNLPSLNILGEFIVTDWSMGTSEGCTAALQVCDPAIFDDAVGKPYNPIGFINLPAGGLGSPTGLRWTPDDTAEVTQGVLSWAAPTGIVSSYAIAVRQAGTVVQAHQVPAASTQIQLSGLPAGSYSMSVAALGPQARSGEATITVNVDGPPVPEGCIVRASLDTITLTPTNTQHRLNGGTYEYFYTRDGSAPVGQAEYLGQGLTFTHTGLAFFANYFYFIRARNAYGVSGYLKVPASTSNDVSAMIDALEDKVNSGLLAPELRKEIELISGDGPGSVNERLGELKQEIGDLVDALEYDPDKVYSEGDSVRQGQRLYQAKTAVPAGAANAPPNVAYWIDVGQVVSGAGATAAQVEKNTASISQQGKDIKATADRLQTVQTRIDDPSTGLSANAQGLSQVKSSVETLDGRVKANAEKLDGVSAQVNPGLAGTEEGFAGSEQTYVGVWSLQSAFIEGDVAQGQRTDQVLVQQGQTNALVQQVSKSVVDLQGATAQQFSQVQAQQRDTSAAVQRNDQAIVSANGRVSAISSWRTETNVNGKKVQTGIVQGSDGSVSEILLAADRVAIINGLNGDSLSNMFIFQDGKAYFNTALINQAFIRELILGMTLRSQATDAQGRPLIELNMATGSFSLRGQDADGRILLNNYGLYTYDKNEVRRTAQGNLSKG